MIKAVRGTRDLLPPETALWNFVEKTVREVFRTYNFHEIRTPIFEDTQLFSRSVGEETDIVAKEMYTWTEGGEGRGVALVRSWLGKHYTQEPAIYGEAVLETPRRGDRLFKLDGRFVAVEFKEQPRTDIVHRLAKLKGEWERVGVSNVVPLLVAPRGFLPPQVQVLAKQLGVETEQVDLEDSGDRYSLTLRPENTAGVVRAYIEHKLWDRGLNKLYYIGPQFRRERPQKGRYRQFYQIGAEIIGPPSAGSESAARDAEIIELLATLLNRLGITGWQLQLNSIGCPGDRETFNAALKRALEPVVSQMCADCQRRPSPIRCACLIA